MGRQSNREYRDVLARADDSGSGMSGHASDFGSVDSYGTAIKRGAFRKTLKERGDRIPVLWQHDPNYPIGVPTELKEDATGLRFNARISEGTEKGRETMALLRDGVPLGMSFGFETIKDRAITDDDEIDLTNAPDYFKSKDGRKQVRIIEEVRLWEISAVTFPSNINATISDVRAVAEAAAITSLLEHIRSDSLTDDQAALVAELVAAFQQRNEPEPEPMATTSLTDGNARRTDILARIALAKHAGFITGD